MRGSYSAKEQKVTLKIEVFSLKPDRKYWEWEWEETPEIWGAVYSGDDCDELVSALEIGDGILPDHYEFRAGKAPRVCAKKIKRDSGSHRWKYKVELHRM